MKIPARFKLFASTIEVVWDNMRMHDNAAYGIHEYSTSTITLSTMHGQQDLSEDRIMDTFYHEKVHAILDAMHERELSGNENFVDVFAKLLRQSDETAEYESPEHPVDLTQNDEG